MSATPSDKDQATYRLRSHIRAQPKTPPKTEGKIGNKKKATHTKKVKSDLNMEQLVEHLKEAQKETEQSLMKAIELNKKELKANMEEVSATLRESVGNIRSDLNRIEETFGTKIQRLQTDLVTVENQIKVTAGRVSTLEEINKESKTEKKIQQDRIKVVEEDITAIRKTHKLDMECLRKELRGFITENKDRMVSQAASIDTLHENTLEQMDELKMIAGGNTSDIRQLAEQVENLDNKSRKKNVVIDGLPEKESDAETKKTLTEYIQKVIPDFQETQIVMLYRIGKPPRKPKEEKVKDKSKHDPDDTGTGMENNPDAVNGKSGKNDLKDTVEETPNPETREAPTPSRKPRTAIVGLATPKWRDLILTNAADIRSNAGVKGFWINRDQNDNSKRKHQLVKACYNLLIENGYHCTIKGSIITMRGRQYDYEKLYMLPDLCTPFYVKSRETLDGVGLCFQSEHVFCSNFASSTIKYDGYTYKTVEHAYQCIKARDAGYTELSEDMRAMRALTRSKN